MIGKRAWLVLLGCVMMYGAMMGIGYNCAGVLISGIINAQGYSSTDVSGFYSMRSLVSAVSMLFAARLLSRCSMKWIIFLSGFATGLTFVLMYFYTEPWMWSISGVLVGLGTGLAVMLVTLIIRNWFTRKRGTIIGIVTMFSGVLGAVLNPPVSELISLVGWRFTALILGGAAFFVISVSAVLIERQPSDVGEEPYGGVDPSLASLRKGKESRKVPFQLTRYVFVLFAVCTGALCVQVISYVPQFSTSLGYPLMVGATLTSAIMVGNTSSKLLFGVATDYLGPWRSIQLFFGLITASFLIFIFFSQILPLLYLAGALLGFAYSNGLGISLVCVDAFPAEDYEVHYSRVSLVSNLIAALVPTVVSVIFDAIGTFRPVFTGFAALLTFSVVLISLRGKLGIVPQRK